MQRELTEQLVHMVHTGGAAYVRNLAAAETAIHQGQFNVAKILRATGHVQRILATNAARLLQPQIDSTSLLAVVARELDISQDAESSRDAALEPPHESNGELESAARQFLTQAREVQGRAQEILTRAQASLAQWPDVLERDVHLFIRGCYGCGNLVEGDIPPACDICGAPRVEFESFGPYYLSTPEHLGRLQPAEIIEILMATPAILNDVVASVDERKLEIRPTPDEWSAKVNIGHFIETDRLFVDMFNHTMGSTDPLPYYAMRVVPWLMHEGKGYETAPLDQLTAQFAEGRAVVVDIFRNLTPEQWSLRMTTANRVNSVVDEGRWLANHDLGHMVHIRRLAGKT